MKRVLLLACVAFVSTFAGAQVPSAPEPREPLSPVLLEHFYKQIYEWDRGAQSGPNASLKAFADADFLTKTRPQLQQAGAAAFPLAAKVTDLMLTSEKNRYTLAYLVMGMTPAPAEKEVPALARAAEGPLPQRLVAYAQLGRSNTRVALDVLRTAARAQDVAERLMGTVALAYLGRGFPEEAATALAPNLKDSEKAVRTAAVNGLRLIGAPAQAVAPQLLEYLRSRDNPYLTTAALKNLPVALLAPAKAELEAIVADPKLNSMQKQDAVDLLVKLATER